MDTAVMRDRGGVAQGALGHMMSFSEKYALIGMQRVFGYLADRIPVRFGRGEIARSHPVDFRFAFYFQSNPASDVLTAEAENDLKTESLPEAEQVDIAGASNQIEIAEKWIRSAGAPSPESFIIDHGRLASRDRQTGESSVILKSTISTEEAFGLASQIVWVSAFAISKSWLSTLLEDADAGLLIEADLSNACGTYAEHVYTDPIDIFGPHGPRDTGTDSRVHTVDPTGSCRTYELNHLSSQLHWLSRTGEEERIVPVSWLRKDLGVASINGESLVAVDGTNVGRFHSFEDLAGGRRGCGLSVNESRVLSLVERRGSRLVWAVRILRQAEPWLILRTRERDHQEIAELDTTWLVWRDGGMTKRQVIRAAD